MKFEVRNIYMSEGEKPVLCVSGCYVSEKDEEEKLVDVLRECSEKLYTVKGLKSNNMVWINGKFVLRSIPVAILKAMLRFHDASIFNYELQIVFGKAVKSNQYRSLVERLLILDKPSMEV